MSGLVISESVPFVYESSSPVKCGPEFYVMKIKRDMADPLGQRRYAVSVVPVTDEGDICYFDDQRNLGSFSKDELCHLFYNCPMDSESRRIIDEVVLNLPQNMTKVKKDDIGRYVIVGFNEAEVLPGRIPPEHYNSVPGRTHLYEGRMRPVLMESKPLDYRGLKMAARFYDVPVENLLDAVGMPELGKK